MDAEARIGQQNVSMKRHNFRQCFALHPQRDGPFFLLWQEKKVDNICYEIN